MQQFSPYVIIKGAFNKKMKLIFKTPFGKWKQDTCSTGILGYIYDKRDDFVFEIVHFPFLYGEVPRSTSMELIFLNSYDLLEHLAMLLAFILPINC